MRDEVKLTVDTLRYCEESGACCGECPSGVGENGVPNCHSQARIADLIEALAAELKQVEQERDGLNILLAQAQSMLETRTRERDAAVEELDHFCDNCKYVDNAYGEEPCPTHTEYDHCDRCPGWQWRGVKEE